MRKPVKAKASPAPKAKAPAKAKDVLFNIYSDASKSVEEALIRSQASEDVSGFWPDSLVLSLCYGKINSGLYVASGPEQSAKSTAMASIMGQSIRNKTVLHKHYDVESAMRSSYMGNIIARHSGISWEDLQGKKDVKGNVVSHPRYRWFVEGQLERVFTEIRKFLGALPDKIYIPETETWRLVFDIGTKDDPVPKGHDELHKKVAAAFPLDSKLSTRDAKYYDIGDDPTFQCFYAIDSIKALTLKQIETEERGFNQPGQLAKALSDHLPYVKGLLRSKHAVMLVINQMYTNPLQRYGSPEYETAGNAIKLHSDSRCLMRPCAILDHFTRSKKTGICEEESVLGNGIDEYTFKRVTNIKNKFSVPYIVGHLRIWSSGPKCAPGIDPVFDTVEFLRIIGLASIGTKSGKMIVTMAKSPLLENYSGEVFTWDDFKTGVLAECGLGDPENAADLRDLCHDLLASGKAHELYADRDLASFDSVHHLSEDEQDAIDDADEDNG